MGRRRGKSGPPAFATRSRPEGGAVAIYLDHRHHFAWISSEE